MIYARAIMEQAGAVADKRQRFRESSMDWHRFLCFQSAVEGQTGSRKRKRAPFFLYKTLLIEVSINKHECFVYTKTGYK